MKKKFKLGIIGCGFMASAIINGAIKSKVLTNEQIIVSDISQQSLDKLSNLNISTTLDNIEVVDNSEFVLFAIKPQGLSLVLEQIKGTNPEKIISIMAGVKKQKIKTAFPKTKIARCMPNTPCSIGYGAAGLDVSEYDGDDKAFIINILSSFAKVVLVDEDKLNAVIGVSGSSPAYFYLFLKYVIENGVKNGLNYEDAKSLAVSTMIGAGKMVENNLDVSLDNLINAVCSKGGTTIEAINVFKNDGLDVITERAIDACVKRAEELENL